VRLRASVLVAMSIAVLAALPALATSVTPSTAKLAAAKPAGSKEKDAAPVDSFTILERAVAKDSTNYEKLYRLGVLYLDRERMPEATRVLKKALAARPNDLKSLVNLGVAQDALGNSAEAQGYYLKALEVAPGDSIATCRLASSWYAQQKYQEAVNLLRKLIAAKPGAHCAYFTLGVAFADAGLYRDAIRMWKRVTELAPESGEAVSAKESIEVLERFVHSTAPPEPAHDHK